MRKRKKFLNFELLRESLSFAELHKNFEWKYS